MPFVDLAAQAAAIREEAEAALLGALRRTDWILGVEVEAFEREFAAYCGADEAVGVDSGTSALELALRAAGVGEGDEVITAANSFVASALAISQAGARPVLVDVDPDWLTLDPERTEAAITPRTRAIVPVHLYGQPADMRAICDIADRHGLAVIEDACQAHGARDHGRRVGGLGRAAAFSFYPAKNLGAAGDAGAVVTNDVELAARVRMLRNYGQRAKYDHVVRGFNRRLDTVQAALLRVKLPYLDGWNARRRTIAARYAHLLSGLPIGLPACRPGVAHVWHLYVIRVSQRDEVRRTLAAAGIASGIHYPLPIHLQPAYTELGQGVGSFPVSEAASREVLSLPMYPELPALAQERVADALAEAVGARGGASPAAVLG